jgi:hypothetical protein
MGNRFYEHGTFRGFCEDETFRRQVLEKLDEIERSCYELREKFESWGFCPPLDRLVRELIRASGYAFRVHQDGGDWGVTTWPVQLSKFDPAQAKKAIDDLKEGLTPFGHITRGGPDVHDAPGDPLMQFSLRKDEIKDQANLAATLCLAASASVEKHGDLRDAAKHLGDYELRDQSHPNATKRDNLHRILCHYVTARERYLNEAQGRLATWQWNQTWFDTRLRQFLSVAAEYVDTPDAHTPWLTSQICAWLLRPLSDMLDQAASRAFPPGRIGAELRPPWSVIVPLSLSAFLLVISVALAAGSYLLIAPVAGYAVAGLCALAYARRYVVWRDFMKDRNGAVRLSGKVAALRMEVETGVYDPIETIGRFRSIAREGLLLPSIFVTVMRLHDSQSAGNREPVNLSRPELGEGQGFLKRYTAAVEELRKAEDKS